MKKVFKNLLIILFIAGAGYAGYFFVTTNNKSIDEFEIGQAFITTIEEKTVATGKVVPEDEVEIKPNLSGIIERVMVEEGQIVQSGDLLAKIKVVPNEASLNSARGRVKNAEIVLQNAEQEFQRNKKLYEKGVIADQTFNNAELNYLQSKQELSNARSDYQVIKLGTSGGGAANTDIRATVTGTIIDIPVKKGDQVIESNNFNPGTTVAIIADLDKMIFEGKVDEAEVGKLKIGMPLAISLAAIEEKEYQAKLKFIAPKGDEEGGAVQFEIKADITLDGNDFVRAGYSANASMVIDKKEDVLAVKEEWLQYDSDSDSVFVEVKKGDQEFDKLEVKLGLSDGMNTEILSGVTREDEIKIWNKTEPIKKGDKDKS